MNHLQCSWNVQDTCCSTLRRTEQTVVAGTPSAGVPGESLLARRSNKCKGPGEGAVIVHFRTSRKVSVE